MKLRTAVEILDAAQSAAIEEGLLMSIVAVDAAGREVAMHRMDGAGFLSPRIAHAKAYTAAATAVPTSHLPERLEKAPYFVTASSILTGGKFLAGGGGWPVFANGVLIGGIGASGGTAAQDSGVLLAALKSVAVVDDPSE